MRYKIYTKTPVYKNETRSGASRQIESNRVPINRNRKQTDPWWRISSEGAPALAVGHEALTVGCEALAVGREALAVGQGSSGAGGGDARRESEELMQDRGARGKAMAALAMAGCGAEEVHRDDLGARGAGLGGGGRR
jgi:hypothetical protein